MRLPTLPALIPTPKHLETIAPRNLAFTHSISSRQEVNLEYDYFLLEHLNAGHLTSCVPLSASTADATVLHAPVREELP
jgi:hypothetical protein